MDKERVLDMVSMRLDGASFQEIGEKYGISKQATQQYLLLNLRMQGRKLDKEPYYPRLNKWMLEHHVKQADLAIRCGVSVSHFSRIVNGNIKPRIDTIEKILEVTGLSYEEAFRKEQ